MSEDCKISFLKRYSFEYSSINLLNSFYIIFRYKTIRCKVSATYEMYVVLTFFMRCFPPQRIRTLSFFLLERVKGRCAPL